VTAVSDTDKTRPWMVRAAEHPGVTCLPVHDHRYGVCTLPDRPADALGYRMTGCHWTWTAVMAYGRDGGCGCRMCTNHYERREQRRRDRHDVRRALRDPQNWDA